MKKRAAAAFFVSEGTLYTLFLTRDILSAGDTTVLKFTAILLVAVAGMFAGKQREDRLVTAALWLTVCADMFLLVLDRYYGVGVLLFCVVQFFYALRLSPEKPVRALLIRAIPAAAAAAIGSRWGAMTALPAYYIVWFAGNLLAAWRDAAKRKKGRSCLFALGLLLFFCCDLCVGLHNLPQAGMPGWLPGFAQNAMWAFYLPGQIMILSSTHVWKGEEE